MAYTPSPFMTIGAVAWVLDVSQRTILSLIHKGDLPEPRLREGRMVFARTEIQRYLNERTGGRNRKEGGELAFCHGFTLRVSP